jgi:alpha-galactosidase
VSAKTKNVWCVTALSVLALCCLKLSATESSQVDRLKADDWIAAKFLGNNTPVAERGYLLPLFKSGHMGKRERQNHPLNIGGVFYQHGVSLPSTGSITVHLPRKGAHFTAAAGVDSNDLSYYSTMGRGDATVSIELGGKEVFRSAAMREGTKPIPLDVRLAGVTDFVIKVSGDHPDWDPVDLVDARVTLEDGTALSLDELPIGPLEHHNNTDVPFSFVYGGHKSTEFLNSWEITKSSRQLDNQRTEYTNAYRDPATGLQIRCVGVAYKDFPTVEWVVYFKNTGTHDTPILEHIFALDTRFERDGAGEFVVHHNKGAPATPNDYQPYTTQLGPSTSLDLGAAGGRPSNKDLPYFSLASAGEGVIVAVGWPGQWSGQLTRDASNGIQLQAGQELTHLKLLPGEEIRTPLIALQFWSGDWLSSQNTWRRWMIAHNMPHPYGQPPLPQLAVNTSHEFVEMTEAKEADENNFIDLYLANGIHPDYFWMDAGWYPNAGSWVNVGTWEVDKNRFPRGLRGVSDHAHTDKIKTIVWFEPERVTKGTWLYEHHPEWLLTPPLEKPDGQLYDKEWRLLNLGNDDAREWITNHVDQLITSEGIDLYRQDFNMDPLYFWRTNDAPDRQGITENKYVSGYLEYWDELRRRHPDMLIDSCASGGRRNDIETLRRAVPLTRSDYLLESDEPISEQMQTYGMAMWIPYFGTGVNGTNEYVFRSQMTPAVAGSWDLRRKDVDVKEVAKLLSQWKLIAPAYLGDFYPLSEYSMEKTVWAAMQFDQPGAGSGFVVAFRRSGSPYDDARFKLHGLNPADDYEINDLDSQAKLHSSGRELMDQGIEVSLKQAPSSALLVYKRMAKDGRPIQTSGGLH